MKKIQKLHLVKETVRDLVPSQLSQIHGGGGISIFTESVATTGAGTGTQAKPQGGTTTATSTITQ